MKELADENFIGDDIFVNLVNINKPRRQALSGATLN
jgi:hypothetical protein